MYFWSELAILISFDEGYVRIQPKWLLVQKKGGNVKTIPPYKPVSHDSPSSDSSGEKEGDASPVASGSGTPTHAAKAKGVCVYMYTFIGRILLYNST